MPSGSTPGQEARMVGRQWKIGLRIALVLGGAVGGCVALLAFVVMTYHAHLERSGARAAFVLAATDLGRQAQVHFKIQVQEWKNVLLRGADPELLKKYRAGFEKEEAAVRKNLTVLRERLTAEGV